MKSGPVLLGLFAVLAVVPSTAGAADLLSHEPAGGGREALDYWTPERIAETGPPPAQGPAPGVAAGAGAAATRAKKKEVRRRARKSSFVSGRVPDPREAPFISTGRLLGRIPGVGGFGCSGTVIRSASRSLVLTAAHCLFSASRFADTLIFIPAFRNGQEPYGRWSTERITIPGGYPATSDPRLDYGTALISPRGDLTIEDAVGSRKIRYKTKKRQTYRALGYPANKGDGKRLWSCRSKAQTELRYGKNDSPVGIGCNMTFGASGGPWIGDSGDVVSVTSVLVEGYKDYIFGPRLGSDAHKLVDQAGQGSRG